MIRRDLFQVEPTSFGRLLSRLRRQAGLSQLELSLEAEISTRYLGFLEAGRRLFIPMTQVARLFA